MSDTSVAEDIEQIDRMLFDAGVLALQAAGKRGIAVDSKITDARVRLEHLRARLT